MTLQTRSMLFDIPAVAIAKPVASASMCQPKLPKSPHIAPKYAPTSSAANIAPESEPQR